MYRRFSEAERAELWDLFERGWSERQLAAHLGRNKGSIRQFLLDNAGRRPRPPGSSDLRLTLAERKEISRGLTAGASLRAIAAAWAKRLRRCAERWPPMAVAATTGR
jgi:IS30 family transposase